MKFKLSLLTLGLAAASIGSVHAQGISDDVIRIAL